MVTMAQLSQKLLNYNCALTNEIIQFYGAEAAQEKINKINNDFNINKKELEYYSIDELVNVNLNLKL